MLPWTNRVRETDPCRLITREGSKAIRYQTVLSPITTSNGVTRTYGGDSYCSFIILIKKTLSKTVFGTLPRLTYIHLCGS